MWTFSLFQHEEVVQLAQMLLGQIIVTEIGGITMTARIVETEAYKAPEDKASHAYLDKRTARTATLFLQGGHSYVYLCYGIHSLFNVVTGRQGVAHAVLIRAVEPLTGIPDMLLRRKMDLYHPSLTNGPGKWTQAMGIDTTHNGIQLYDPDSIIRILKAPTVVESDIICGPRVGIAYAGECAMWPWRFRIKNHPFTSLPHTVSY